jgi:hypothetical protein
MEFVLPHLLEKGKMDHSFPAHVGLDLVVTDGLGYYLQRLVFFVLSSLVSLLKVGERHEVSCIDLRSIESDFFLFKSRDQKGQTYHRHCRWCCHCHLVARGG